MFYYNIMDFDIVKDVGWQDICAYLDATYKLTELKKIAEFIGINTEGLTKSQICDQLAQDYNEYIKNAPIPCINEPLIEETYNTSDPDLITFTEGGQKFCFTLDEFQGIKK